MVNKIKVKELQAILQSLFKTFYGFRVFILILRYKEGGLFPCIFIGFLQPYLFEPV
jgi:hypothetical protein